jgi:AmmeMemoRadiSam system protein B
LYPGDPETLRELMGEMSESANAAQAIVVPHSDLNLVAPVSAAAFARLAPARRVVVIGPSHKLPFAGLAVPNADGWTTPLGTLHIDTAAYDDVASMGMVRVMDAAFDVEPAVELQLPWLQVRQRKPQLVPLLCGDAKDEDVAQVLDALLLEDTVLVVACELAWDRSEREVHRIDEATFDAITALAPDRLQRAHVTAGTPLGALLRVARRRGWSAETLLHQTSRELGATGDRVAGYAAVGFFDAPNVPAGG